MRILNGRDVANFRKKCIAETVAARVAKGEEVPGLAVVLVGDDPASQVYVSHKEKACKSVGINSWVHRMPATTTEEELKEKLTDLNADDSVHGILVQLPLPRHLDSEKVLRWIAPHKDADGLSIESMGALAKGQPQVVSCTPAGVMAIFKYYDIPLEGKDVVVVGRSQIVGLPMSLLLQQANATVTLCHSRTKDLSAKTRAADIVVVAAGRPRFMGKDDFKKGAVVVDVGIHRDENNKLCGDVRFEELEDWVDAITPVPGGVGPMTIAMLLENTCRLAGIDVSI